MRRVPKPAYARMEMGVVRGTTHRKREPERARGAAVVARREFRTNVPSFLPQRNLGAPGVREQTTIGRIHRRVSTDASRVDAGASTKNWRFSPADLRGGELTAALACAWRRWRR